MTMENQMEISAGEFKAKCLKLMDEVASSHEKVVITKRGKPVAMLVPVAPEEAKPVHYLVEKRLIDETNIPSESVRTSCAACHAFAQPLSPAHGVIALLYCISNAHSYSPHALVHTRSAG